MKKAMSIILNIVMVISLCVISVTAEENDAFSLSPDYAVTQIIERGMIDQTNKSGIYADAGQTFTLFVSPSNTEPSTPQQILVENDTIMIRNSYEQDRAVVWEHWRMLNQNDHEIYVVCDGNNDELKLQAAMETAPNNSIIYPVGECVITNENTIDSDDFPNNYKSILKIKSYMSIDGRYCEKMVFKNTLPSEHKMIFYMSENSSIRNLNFYEEDCSIDKINPIIIYSCDYGEVINCKFYNLFDTNEVASSCGINMNSYSKFSNNLISGWTVNPYSSVSYSFRMMRESIIENNIFENIIAIQPITGNVISTLSSNINNNTFKNCNLNGGNMKFSGGRFSGNYFNNVSSAYILLGGNIFGCNFNNVSSESDTIFDISQKSIVTGCIFQNCSLVNGTYMFDLGQGAIFSDNIIYNASLPSEQEIFVAILNKDTMFMNNRIHIKSESMENPEMYVLDGYEGSVCMNNVTNSTSMGRFDDTCTVTNNVVSN